MTKERWNGPYRYLQMTFHEQNRALAVNSPLAPGYERGALYVVSDQGDVKIWRRDPSKYEAD